MEREVYLDHAATTPIRAAALATLVRVSGLTGNAASVHGPGRAARAVLEDARESVATSLRCRPDEVVFTSGGTEADNLAVAGLYRSRVHADPLRQRVLVSAVEHPAVAACAGALAAEGAELVTVPVDASGRVDPGAAADLVSSDGGPATVALLACMWANNEVGTVQPLAELGALAARHGIAFHVDAVQAAGSFDVCAERVGATTLAVSGHKVGGPVGCGVLVVRGGSGLAAVLHGGGQEAGLRPGTVAVAAAAATAVALGEAVAQRGEESARVASLRDRLVEGARRACPEAALSGPELTEQRLPGIAHLTFPGCDSESLLVLLDRAGIAASTGSACRSGVLEPSPVLLAMGMPADRAAGAVRFSLGHTTTEADVERVIDVIGGVVAQARAVLAA